MPWIRRLGLVCALLVSNISLASAQLYEYIGACKRSMGIQITCIVIEKAAEKIIEKKAQEWWDYWVSGEGKKAASPNSDTVPFGNRTPQTAEIIRDGYDYRALMRDFDGALGRAPRGLSDAKFAELLGASCAKKVSAFVCREFRPLFSDKAPKSTCRELNDEKSCLAESRCRWRFNLCVVRSQ